MHISSVMIDVFVSKKRNIMKLKAICFIDVPFYHLSPEEALVVFCFSQFFFLKNNFTFCRVDIQTVD